VEDPGSEIHLSTGSDRSCNANGQVTVDEDDDDEELRPAKRRKRDLVHPTRPHQPPTPPDNSLEAPLRQPRSATASSTTQLEDNSTQRRADHGKLLTPAEVEHHPSRSSRSPSATRESVPLAEYQEWPFQGFLKRTRIGNDTTYHLEFKLPCISERLDLPIGVCEDDSNKNMPATPLTRLKAPYSQISPASRPRKRVGWAQEDDTRLVDMKNRGCSWKEIYAAFPERTPGTIHVRCSTKLKSRLA
jgi:hypothetical protein